MDHCLKKALAGDPAIVLAGGHKHAGSENTLMDRAMLAACTASLCDVSAFAVARQFGTRNPVHELITAEMIRVTAGAPLSCPHHLSAKLNCPK